MPKSSIERRTPIACSRASDRGARRRVGHDVALGDLELEQRRRGTCVVGEHAATSSGRLGVEQVARREVDRDRDVEPSSCHARALAERLAQHEQRERRISAGVLGERDELARRQTARASGAASARSASTPAIAAGRAVELRLVVQRELVVGDRRGAGRRAARAGRGRSGSCVRLVDDAAPRCAPWPAYIAMSARCEQRLARRRRASGRARCRCWRSTSSVMPSTAERLPQRARGCARRSRRARRRGPRRAAAPRTRRRRAARSCRPRAPASPAAGRSRAAARRRMLCPRVSLISLKRSRSTIKTENGAGSRVRRGDRVLEAVGEQPAVRQPGQCVVQRGVLVVRCLSTEVANQPDHVGDKDPQQREHEQPPCQRTHDGKPCCNRGLRLTAAHPSEVETDESIYVPDNGLAQLVQLIDVSIRLSTARRLIPRECCDQRVICGACRRSERNLFRQPIGIRFDQLLIESSPVRLDLVNQERVGAKKILVDRLALTPKQRLRTLHASDVGAGSKRVLEAGLRP